jgi:hypothetical protein
MEGLGPAQSGRRTVGSGPALQRTADATNVPTITRTQRTFGGHMG